MGHGIQGRTTPRARIDAATAATVAETLQALATPSRLRILSRLREGPATVTELAAATDMEQSAVSHQLRMLRHLGLVAGQRAGRAVTYSLYDNHVAMLLDEAVYHAEHLRLGVRDSPADAGPGGRADPADPAGPAAGG
ncbi:MAG: metalloregulator ArsR/SmtB family transcription factor [Streptosporangiaceae bacterium]|jgi:DNA-binding transcriptional ArsR family regulator